MGKIAVMVEENQCFYETGSELQSSLSKLEASEDEGMFSPFPDLVCDLFLCSLTHTKSQRSQKHLKVHVLLKFVHVVMMFVLTYKTL